MESQITLALVSGGFSLGVATLAIINGLLNRRLGRKDKREEEAVTLKIASRTSIEERVDKLWQEREQLISEANAWRDKWLKVSEDLLEARQRHVAEMEAQATRYSKLEAEHNVLMVDYTNLKEVYAELKTEYADAIRQMDEMKLVQEHMQMQLQKNTDSLARRMRR